MQVDCLIDVAFHDNMNVVKKISYNKTIDVRIGTYRNDPYKDYLAISLNPTHGIKDWLINLMAWGSIHAGYKAEWEKYKEDFIQELQADWAVTARKKGMIIAGRSKGAAEAIIIAYDIGDHNTLVGAIEPPHMCSRKMKDAINSQRPNIMVTCYQNDIVPGIVPWLKIPGELIQIGRRTHGLSIQDHIRSTTDPIVIKSQI